MNLTGLHNASSQGFTRSTGYGLAAAKGESKTKKKFRRDYVLRVAHKSLHKNNKVVKNASVGLSYNSQVIRRDTARVAKSIQGLTTNDRTKRLLLNRLGKLHAAYKA